MDVQARLQRALVYGVCFLFAAIATHPFLKAIGQTDPSDWTEAYRNYAFWVVALGIFFLMYMLTLRGYTALADKYGSPALRIYTSLAAYIVVALYATIALMVLENVNDTRGDLYVLEPLSYVFLTAYVFVPFVLGGTVFRLLRDRAVLSVYPYLIGIVWIIYGFYIVAASLLGIDYPEFLGLFIWMPVPEAVFALASMLLFREVSKQ